MYGVPDNLDLGFLIGGELEQICIGLYQIQLHFSPVGTISTMGYWEVRNRDSQLIDQQVGENTAERVPFELHRLLGQTVVSVEITAPTSLTVRFSDGFSFQLFDDSANYESFTIHPGDIIV
jgi:hypothetical protein